MEKSILYVILLTCLLGCQQVKKDELKTITSMTNYFDESGEILLKLYKNTDKRTLYWETWNTDEENAVVHWGELGQSGEKKVIETDSNLELKYEINSLIDKKKQEGYKEIPIEDQYTVTVTFKTKTWGKTKDLERREEIRNILTEHLGWTGNGRCDDGDIGSGEMTLYADVIDPKLAIKTISKELVDKKVIESPSFTIMQGEKVLDQDTLKEE